MKAPDYTIIQYWLLNLLHQSLFQAFHKPKDLIYSFPLPREEETSHQPNVNSTNKEKGQKRKYLKKKFFFLRKPKEKMTE